MGVYDQAARYAAQAEPESIIRRLLRPTGEGLRFGREFDTRTVPLPGGPDRTADLAAVLDGRGPAEEPVLLVFEFQAEPDVDKLDTTLLEAALYRCYARHGPERAGKFNVQTGLIQLKGRCPASVLRMELSGGFGSVHSCLVWDVTTDLASMALDAVSDGQAGWGLLFWVPLMSGGDEDTVIGRWRGLASDRVPDPVVRANLRVVALTLAELARCQPAWQRGLEGWDVTESPLVNSWIHSGVVADRRDTLVTVLEARFPGAVPPDVRETIQQNESLDLLRQWLISAAVVESVDEFRSVLRR